jgi:hypothetical protein
MRCKAVCPRCAKTVIVFTITIEEAWQPPEVCPICNQVVRFIISEGWDASPGEQQASRELDERMYLQGLRQAFIRMLGVCIEGLGADDSLVRKVRWLKEREEVKLRLHELCREFGDDSWPEDLYLPDVMEKHLAKPLWEMQKRAE